MPQTLKDRFAAPDGAHRPYLFVTLPVDGRADDRAAIARAVADGVHSGCGALIPVLPPETELDMDGLRALRETYAALLSEAAAAGLSVAFYLDPALERTLMRSISEMDEAELRAQTLVCHEHICTRGEQLSRQLHEGKLLSLVAYSEDTATAIDLRPFLNGRTLTWQVPEGNFTVREYLCLPEEDRFAVNALSYKASFALIEAAFGLFADVFAPFLGTTLTLLAHPDAGFGGRNHRDWDVAFNARFEARFGFDPAPFYPALFGYLGEQTEHLRALFMTVRAALLEDGLLKALADFAEQQGLTPFGCLAEPKLTACSLPVGDALRGNRFAPCALYEKAYMYGSNSAKIAAAAAYNFDQPRIGAELFRGYEQGDPALLRREMMNAFARGVNCAALHLPPALCEGSAFGDFAARVQLLLRGGAHVADIALIYPICHLHAKTNLYDSPAEGFEYPPTPETADYMTLMNSVTIHAGHDLTLLHPEVLARHCRAEGGVLYLDHKENSERFRVVILPGAEMVRLDTMRLLKRFFDGGGKLIATGVLPRAALEPDETGENDREVRHIVRQIFGHDACDKRVIRDYCHNKNDRGGEAYFLYFNRSAVDGTQMTTSTTVNEALEALALPFDVYLPAMPRLESTGALNTIYPEFRRIGLDLTFPGGGMLDHIHKRRGETDVYYFSNTTAEDYNHHVLLRGALSVEEWDPETGLTRPRHAKFFTYRGAVYTNLRLTLPSESCILFVATAAPAGAAAGAAPLTSIARLRSEHAELMSEF